MVKLNRFDESPLDPEYVDQFIDQSSSCTFSIGNHIRIPTQSGVYVFSDFSRTLYVGKSDDLHKRYAQHSDGSHNQSLRYRLKRPIGDVRFHYMPIEEEIDNFERALIRVLNPLCNTIRYSGM